MNTLSPSQRSLLVKLAIPDTRLVRWQGFKGAYFKEAYGYPQGVLVTTADILIRRGLVREFLRSPSLIAYVISDAGYAALNIARPRRGQGIDIPDAIAQEV